MSFDLINRKRFQLTCRYLFNYCHLYLNTLFYYLNFVLLTVNYFNFIDKYYTCF